MHWRNAVQSTSDLSTSSRTKQT